MSGNQDRAAEARARADALYDKMQATLERAAEALAAAELTPQEPLFVQRIVRALDLAGRATLTLEKVATGRAGPRKTTDETEQDVSKADRDDSPATLDRIRDELMDDFDRIHAALEQKAAVRGDDGGRTAPDERPPALAA